MKIGKQTSVFCFLSLYTMPPKKSSEMKHWQYFIRKYVNYGKKSEIYQRKRSKISHRLCVVRFHIYPERNNAGKACDNCSETAYVGTQHQSLCVFGKSRKHYGGGDVAYKLADNDRGRHLPAAYKMLRKALNGRNIADISNKNEKEAERQKQAVIHAHKQIWVNDYCNNAYRSENNDNVQNVKYRKQTKREQHRVHNDIAFLAKLYRTAALGLHRLVFDKKTEQENKQAAEHKHGNGSPEKLLGGHFIMPVQIQILRIAERGQHTSQICRCGLQNYHVGHGFFMVRKKRGGYGYKGYKGNVVGEKQRGKKGNKHQYRSRFSCPALAPAEKLPRKKGKNAAFAKARHGYHQAEQQPDSVGVDIIYIICDGNKHTGNKGGDTRNNENKFMLEKLDKGFHFFTSDQKRFSIIPLKTPTA